MLAFQSFPRFGRVTWAQLRSGPRGWVWVFQAVYLHLEMYGEAQGSKGFHSVSVQHPDVFQSKDVAQRRTSPGLAQVQIPSSHRSRIPVDENVE